MSRKKQNEVLVGSFTVVGGGLFLLLVFLMGGLDGCVRDMTEVRAVFDDVQGLQAGDPVYLFGMRSGNVRAIELGKGEAEGDARLVVTMAIPSAYRPLLRTTTRVYIDKTLTGNLSVLVQQNTIDRGARLPEGRELAGTPAADFGAIAQEAADVLQAAEEAIVAIQFIVDKTQKEGHVTKTLEGISGAANELRALLPTLSSEVKESLDEVDRTLVTVRETVEENRGSLRATLANLETGSASLDKLIASLERTPAEIQEVLAVVRRAAASVGDLVEENRVHLDSILTDLDTTAANAANLTSEVKRRPWRLLYKPTVEEMQALELYDSAWAYNLAATELHKSARNLAAHLERSPAADGTSDERDARYQAALKTALERVEASLRGKREAEEAFWARLNGVDDE